MLKKELESLKKGSQILNKKTNEKVTVLEAGERIVLSNGKDYSPATIIRNFSLIAVEPIQPSQDTRGTNTNQDTSNGADEGSEGDNDILIVEKIFALADELGLTSKANSDHFVLKYNGRNIMEITESKKHFRLVVRQDCLTPDQVARYNENCKGRLVGGGTYVLNYKLQTKDYAIFKRVLKSAVNYQVNRNTKRVST